MQMSQVIMVQIHHPCTSSWNITMVLRPDEHGKGVKGILNHPYGGLITSPFWVKTQGIHRGQQHKQPCTFLHIYGPIICWILPQPITILSQRFVLRTQISLPICPLRRWQFQARLSPHGVYTCCPCLVHKYGDHSVPLSLVMKGWNCIQVHLWPWWWWRFSLTTPAL